MDDIKEDFNFYDDVDSADSAEENEILKENTSSNDSSGLSEEEKKAIEEGKESTLANSITLSASLGSLEVEDDNNDDDDMLSPDERLRSFADTIMSCAVGNKPLKNYTLEKLTQFSSPELFRDENYILFLVFYTYRGKLKQIDIDEEFIKLFLNRNRKVISQSRAFIDINAYGEVDGSVELGYISGVLKHFKRLVAMEEISQVELDTTIEKYLIEFKAIEAEKVYNTARIILTDGYTIGRKKLFGFEDSNNYVKRRLAEIEGLISQDTGSGFITAREMLTQDNKVNKSYKISDFDRLTALTDVYGGIYTSMFYQFIAPPKAGKTKLCARLVHRCITGFGNNVTVWAMEGGKEAFLAELRAIHFDYIYNTGVSVTEKKFGICQDVILHDKYPNEELRALELSSKIDLASNLDYGNVDFIDRPFNIETFLEDLQTSIESNHSQMVVIDYLQLIDSSTGKPERERIAEAYKSLLRFCKNKNIAVISPGQYNQESVNALISKGDTQGVEMRTSGGNSAEVIRTPDVIFALWASTQDILNNTMKILSVPGRFSKAFPEINVITDYSVAQFISVNDVA